MKQESLLRRLLRDYREQLAYLFFGVVTTVVNYAVFWLLSELLDGRYVLLINLAAFFAATAVAFVTNKLFVFCSASWKPSLLLREALAFYAARLFSFGVEEAGLYVSAYVLCLDRYWVGPVRGIMLAKILLSVVVVVLNYFFSKFFVFSKSDKEG